ncbi:MAG: hypothetical protein AAF570_17415, partial [Bacteroidota bacterium]
IASCDMAMKVKDDKQRYEIVPVSRLNSKYSDIVAINSRDEIVFATRGKKREIGTLRQSKRQSKDYDFYKANKRADGSITDVKPIRGGINSRYDDVGAVKMPGTDLVLFTRAGDMQAGRKKTVGNNEANTEIKILGARRKGKKMEVQNLPFQMGDGAHNFHPAIHPSGDAVIFASDRPGGYGGVDLYMVKKQPNGEWGEAVNLGPDINTDGDELFPTFNKQGYIYFASDGHIGYGGLDLYTADMEKGAWGNTMNMGAGINSGHDDFGIVWDPATSSGYFTSNRNNETGDDIYRFKRTPGITGQVFDGMTKDALAGSIIRLKDISGNEKIIISDGIGQFSEPCKQNTGYLLTVDAPGFHTWRDTFWTKTIPQGRDVNMDIYLEVEQLFEMRGFVFDGMDKGRLAEADIEVITTKKSTKHNANPDSANYKLRLKPGSDYTVIFRKDSYIPRIVNLSLSNFRGVEVRTRNVPMAKGEYVLINGNVVEDGTKGSTIERASVSIVNNVTQEVIDSTLSLRDGSFWVAIPWDSLSNYSLISSKPGYYSASSHIMNKTEEEAQKITMAMVEATFGLDHSIKVINYGYNETKLDLLSKKDLNEIYFFLLNNPEAKLEVRSHTDARGSQRYNLELSR